MEKPIYPFAAIVGQEEMKLSLILCAIYPRLSGVLIQGDKGTAKSTAVRGMAIVQNSDDELPMSRISVVFIPRNEVTKESGRKITVTIVKTMIALPWSSSVISKLCLVLSESGLQRAIK